MDALKLSFSAAALVFLSAAARTGIVAPDFLLFLRTGSGRLDVCKLFQKVGAYCLIRHFHREDLPAEVLDVHFAGLERFADVRTQRERLEALFRRRHLPDLNRRMATVAGHSRRVVKRAVQGDKPLCIPLGSEPDAQLFQRHERIRRLGDSRTDVKQQIFKHKGLAFVAQAAAVFQEGAQPARFRRVLAVEGIAVCQQMLFVRHIIGLILLAALCLYIEIDGRIDQGDINDLAVEGLCVPDVRVQFILAQNVVALALVAGDLCKGKKFVLRYQLRAEGEEDLLCLVSGIMP